MPPEDRWANAAPNVPSDPGVVAATDDDCVRTALDAAGVAGTPHSPDATRRSRRGDRRDGRTPDDGGARRDSVWSNGNSTPRGDPARG